MHSRKGLSDIVTNVLIILLVLVAIGVIWAFVRPTIDQGAGQLEGVTTVYGTMLSLDPSSATIDTTNEVVSFIVRRNEGDGAMVGFNVILANSAGASRLFRENVTLEPLESRRVSVDYTGWGLGQPARVSVAPIFGSNSGQERIGSVSDPLGFSGNTTTTNVTTAVCGNGVVQSPEVCDDGNTVSETTCTVYGGSGTYCNAGCTATIALTCPRCGDSIIQTGNGEQCEGSNLNGQSCMSVAGLNGTLSCYASTAGANACRFNTSACTTGTQGNSTQTNTTCLDC